MTKEINVSLKNFQFRVGCGVHICVPITHETEAIKLSLRPARIMQLGLISRKQEFSVQRRAPQTKISNRCPNRKDVSIFLTTVQASTKTQRKGKRGKGGLVKEQDASQERRMKRQDPQSHLKHTTQKTNYIKVLESHQS